MKDYIAELQDLRRLDWADTKYSPGTPGCFLKAYEEKNGTRFYYKLSNYDSYQGVFGHECINELIVSRLLEVLGVEHLPYQLVHALIKVDGKETETYIVRSENFRKEGENKIPFDAFYDLHRQGNENPLEFAVRMGWETYFYQMMAVDYLICNRDRHGANIEILVDEAGAARPAQLFDHGLSLLFSCYGDVDSVKQFDVRKDRPVNSFIGSRSLEYNLSLIPAGYRCFPKELQENDRVLLLGDLTGLLPEEHFDKIWEMIWERWRHYVQVCNQKRCAE